jgi:ribosomal protein S18 acetylase RimI-like enzyme
VVSVGGTATVVFTDRRRRGKGGTMIRPTVRGDAPALLALTEGTGLFSPLDLKALDEVLTDYHDALAAAGHRCFTYEEHGQVIGFVYYAAAAMTDRTWYLWWIVVGKQTQARGLGGRLLRQAEDGARAENGRLMMVETSGLPSYELTRKFYLKHGYQVAGVLQDYYADGHDMVIYRKRL